MKTVGFFYNSDAETDGAASCCYCGDAIFEGTHIAVITNGTTVALAHEECHFAHLEDAEDDDDPA